MIIPGTGDTWFLYIHLKIYILFTYILKNRCLPILPLFFSFLPLPPPLFTLLPSFFVFIFWKGGGEIGTPPFCPSPKILRTQQNLLLLLWKSFIFCLTPKAVALHCIWIWQMHKYCMRADVTRGTNVDKPQNNGNKFHSFLIFENHYSFNAGK